jgi:5-methyltetrahydrofolate--homocysteine methyltransferase
MEILSLISAALIEGDDESVPRLTQQAIDAGLPARRILEQGLLAGMAEIGERFQRRDVFLPDVLLAARAMMGGLERLKPLLAGEASPTLGKVVIGTVQGDLHDIGKNLVGIMLRGAGFEVVDLGHDVPPERFVDTAASEGASVIGLSALLTTTMPGMRQVVDLLCARGLAGRVKVIVGGAPVSAEFARAIGADAYGYDAANAVEQVRKLVSAS